MIEPKFKIGDKLKCIKKRTSNYYQIKNLIEVIVIKNDLYPSYTKKLIKVKILKGFAYQNVYPYDYVKVEQEIDLYEECFELPIPEEEDYEIY